jgi:LytS/YehU family sensor histidine kinase
MARNGDTSPAQLVLTVSDDGPGTGESPGFGLGLANIGARLEELYPESHSFRAGPTADGGYRAEISLPLSRAPAVALVPNVIEAQLV